MYNLLFVQIAFILQHNQAFMFQLYLVSVIVFLLPICYSVVNVVFCLFTRYFLFNTLIPLNKYEKLQKDDILSLAEIYIDRNQWLSCILMLEFYSKTDNLNVAEYYNSLGFCYQFMNLNDLSEEYYYKAAAISPYNIIFLKNLATIKVIRKDFHSAINVYGQILLLDSKNKAAIDSIDTLSKYV